MKQYIFLFGIVKSLSFLNAVYNWKYFHANFQKQLNHLSSLEDVLFCK